MPASTHVDRRAIVLLAIFYLLFARRVVWRSLLGIDCKSAGGAGNAIRY
jgi:hypothetical protein